MEQMNYTKERLCKVLHKGEFKGFKFAIVSYGTHPCCYVFLPKEHKYYGKSYDEIDIDCHGGLTYSDNELIFNPLVNDDWVIGWDYAHLNDYSGIYKNEFMREFDHSKDKKWTTEELFEEVKQVIEQL